MRLKKTIDLGDGRAAVVREMQVAFVRNLLVNLKRELRDLSVEELLGERFTELGSFFAELVELSDGDSLDSLTFSELQLIWNAFLEVNAAFFDLAGSATGMVSNLSALRPTSTKAAASSSSADTSASAATAGDST